MASLCVFVVNGPASSIRGALQRCMLEIAPGVFTGRIPAKVVRALWSEIQERSDSAVAVVSGRNEMGITVLTHGSAKRTIVDNYGVPLVMYRKAKNNKNPR